MHHLHLEFATLSELAAAVAKLSGNDLIKISGESNKPAASSQKPSASAEAGVKKDEAKPVVKEAEGSTATVTSGPVEPFPYADLQKAVMALVKLDPQGPKPILAELGIPTFKGSDPAIWAKAKGMLEAATAAKEAA